MLKIVAVGNSFSQDATTYLDRICEAAGKDVYVRNLYIGGCSLETHANNIKDCRLYSYEKRGAGTGVHLTLTRGLAEEKWDIVTMQQASHFSGISETYYPYINELSDYVKKLCPDAKQYIHKTWAYEWDFGSEAFANAYKKDQNYMYDRLSEAYASAAEKLGLPMILSGDVIQKLRKTEPFDYRNGGLSLCRDGFHLSFDYGRYAAGAVWFETLVGGDIRNNTYAPENADPKLISLIKETVHEVCNK
ncbi:MAG: DUF4886 domain-containing protein [Clostridia bacterium]|nr:DUF4886 domain-containing protein [Clostridia bacterium]